MPSHATSETPTEWVISSRSLNSDRERAIYELGKEKGAEEIMQKYDAQIKENFAKSYIDTSKVLEKLKADNINIISARLKMDSIHCFKILLSVKDNSDKPLNLENAYKFIYDIESASNNENYMVDFSIVKANDNFSDSRVENDGYIYKHRLFVNEEEARTT